MNAVKEVHGEEKKELVKCRRTCDACGEARAVLVRPKTGAKVCRGCFFRLFEHEVHETITQSGMFVRGERVAIGVSGGKDSAVLAHVLTKLNSLHKYGITIVLVAVDEGIQGYRDDSLKAVQRMHATLKKMYGGIELCVVSFDMLFGWTMDKVVQKIGLKGNCTVCGVLRRQALERGARRVNADHIVTGHNADDTAETVLMNLFRGDKIRLPFCTLYTTGSADESAQDAVALRRSKPLRNTYEKEIVMYAYFNKLEYFSTECTYAPNSFRSHARTLLRTLSAKNPRVVLDIIRSGETFTACSQAKSVAGKLTFSQKTCAKCGSITLNELCKACLILEKLDSIS